MMILYHFPYILQVQENQDLQIVMKEDLFNQSINFNLILSIIVVSEFENKPSPKKIVVSLGKSIIEYLI